MTQSYRKLIYLIVFSQLINERISKRVQVSVGLFQMLNQVCTVHPLWSAGKREITISRLKENIVRWPLEPLLYNLKQSCVDRTSKTRLRCEVVPPLHTSNRLIAVYLKLASSVETGLRPPFVEISLLRRNVASNNSSSYSRIASLIKTS